MSVEFEEQEFAQPTTVPHTRHGVVTSLLLKIGVVQNPSQANVLMLFIAIIAIGLSVYLLLPDDAVAPTTIPTEQ